MDTICLQCQLKRNLETVRPLGGEAKALEFAKKVMQLIIDAPPEVPSPFFSPPIADLMESMYGLPIDRLHSEKEMSNRFALERLDRIRELVRSVPDPLFAALQFAILGNYLDFGALQGQVSFEKLEGMLLEALQMELDRQVYDALCADLAAGKKLVYLTDNAGEIVFDRVLAEEIAAKFPNISITFCVRGGITLNDATREDAAGAGIPFPVIDNGNRVPGTMVELLGDEARTALEQADVVISKGMGNVETLWGSPYNVYYAFLVKCQKFVACFGKPLMTPMLMRESAKEEQQ